MTRPGNARETDPSNARAATGSDGGAATTSSAPQSAQTSTPARYSAARPVRRAAGQAAFGQYGIAASLPRRRRRRKGPRRGLTLAVVVAIHVVGRAFGWRAIGGGVAAISLKG